MNFEALNLIALNGVKNRTFEYQQRMVMRWYSKTFSTPLHVVESLIPLEDIWLAFLEERYEGLEPEELELAIEHALLTPEERARRNDESTAEEIGAEQFAKMTEEAAKTPVAPALPLNVIPEPVQPPPPLPPLEPDIKFEFVDDSEMEALLATDTKPVTK